MLSLFREDLSKHRSGAPIYIGDSVFYLRRWGDDESLKIRRQIERELFGPFHSKQEGSESQIIAHWLVEYGVAKWESVIGVDGKEVKYSKENARRIFLNPEYHLSLNQRLFFEAGRFENFLHEDAEEDLEAIKKS